MIATLPMYDPPALRAANDALWQAIRTELGHGPDALDRGIETWTAWRSPDLLLSQTCSLPYRHALHGRVALVGCPDYGLTGCAPGFYRSVIVARDDDPRPLAALLAARAAINEPLSQSGYAALYDTAQTHGVMLNVAVVTGAHAASAQCVAEGGADVAAIDAHTWRLAARTGTLPAGLRVVAQTEPRPGLPFITAPDNDADAIRAALNAALRRLDPDTADLLGLRGVVPCRPETLCAVPTPPVPA